MIILNAGYTVSVTLADGESLTVESRGGATVTAVSGLGVTGLLGTVDGSRTFGPYSAGVVSIAAVGGDCSYGVTARPDVESNAGRTGVVIGGTEIILPSRLDASIPSPDYHVALRGGQTGFGNYTDQSSNANDATINTALFPPARVSNTAYTVGTYRSPSVLTGALYKCTASTGNTAATEPASPWTTTVGGTVVDGGVTWTCEKGPWYIDSTTGLRHFRSIASAQLGVPGSFALPATDWDLAAGDSLIINIHGAFNFTAADEATVISSRGTSGPGFSINATGTTGTFKDFRIFIGDGINNPGTGHVSGAFGRKPLDGSESTTTFMIDGPTKMMYCFGDGIAYTQSDMFSGSHLSPNNFSLAAVTGSTLSTQPITIGGQVGGATTYELGMMHFDVLVLKNRSLPADIQGIANWFHQRGLGLIPYGQVQS